MNNSLTTQEPNLLQFRNESTAVRLAVARMLDEPQPITATIEEWEGPSLNEMIAPTLLEQTLPFLALIAVTIGFVAVITGQPLAYLLILLNPIFVSIYLHMRTERRQRAIVLRDGAVYNWRPMIKPLTTLEGTVTVPVSS